MLRLTSAWFGLVRLRSPTIAHQPALSNQRSPNIAHQPSLTNHRSPTIAHQPSLTNHRSVTSAQQPALSTSSEYWALLLHDSDYISQATATDLLSDNEEITKMLTASINTAKSHLS